MAPIQASRYCHQIVKEVKSGAFWRDCFAEFIGTFLLVLAVMFLLQNWQPAASSNPQALSTQVCIGMSFVGSAIGYGLGDFGGAHMNPAVTMALIIRAEVTIIKGICYWIMQIAGGILGAFYVYAISPTVQITNSKLGNTLLGVGVLWWQGLLIEITITTILCLAAIATGNIPRKGYIILPSLPVGLALGLGHFIALFSTGASMNPARSLGPCVVGLVMMDMDDCMADHWIYWVGPMVGSAVAAMLYWIFDSVDKPECTESTQPYMSNAWLYNTSKRQQQQQNIPQYTNTAMVPITNFDQPASYESPAYVFQQNV